MTTTDRHTGGDDATLDRDTLSAIPAAWASPPPEMVSRLDRGRGLVLDYLGHADVTLALIAIDPAWTWAPAAIDPATGGPVIQRAGDRLVMWGTLTVAGLTRLGVGTCDARKAEPEKELIGDLIRNAAMRFGIGTTLWSKAERHGSADPAVSSPPAASAGQKREIAMLCGRVGLTERADRLRFVSATIGRDVTSAAELTAAEAASVIDALQDAVLDVADAADAARVDADDPTYREVYE